ncbi:O-methyltransferase-domain-containing protein [Abortiporus biennis]|nr:O-methyltransferase-domain-containing protein [Abortiporus biennis]
MITFIEEVKSNWKNFCWSPGCFFLIARYGGIIYVVISRKNIDKAGLSSIAQVIIGPAIESLKTLKPDPPFDLAFIDADKESNLEYFIEAKRLLKKGGVIIVDNVVRNGQVSDPSTYTDSRSEGVRRLLKFLKDDKEVECTTIQTVGEKNHDGFLYAYII